MPYRKTDSRERLREEVARTSEGGCKAKLLSLQGALTGIAVCAGNGSGGPSAPGFSDSRKPLRHEELSEAALA